MRALIIGPDERAAIATVAAYAKDHPYRPGIDRVVPGDNPAYTAHVPDGFRCVFTLTKHQGELYRHLTVSVPGKKYPSPEACVMIAKEFGFATSDDSVDMIVRMEKDGWMTSTGHKGEHCIVVIQPVADSHT